MNHLSDTFGEPAAKRIFAGLTVLAVLTLVAINVVDAPLKTANAPLGIVSFEFAGSQSRADEIISSWGESARVSAGVSLGLDYLFLVAYSSAIALGCLRTAHAIRDQASILVTVGTVLSWSMLLAGILDGVENFALIRVLIGNGGAGWPVVARVCAIPKFALVGVSLLYCLAGVTVRVVTRGNRAT